MRLLDRYLFRELFTPLAFCLGGFLIFWISFDLFNNLDEMQERKLHFFDVLGYTLAMTPEFLVTILPVVVLLALLYTLTNHARHNEITAMRAAGVSLWRFSFPYFTVGLAAGVTLFILNEFFVPRSLEWAWRIKTRYVHKADDPGQKDNSHNFGFTNAREHRTWLIGEYLPERREMIRPQVSWNLSNGSSLRLYADRAIYTNNAWLFFGASEYSQAGPTASLVPTLKTNELEMLEFNETPSQIRSELKISAYLKLDASRKADIPLKTIYDYLRLHPDVPSSLANQLFTKLHGRLAAPWTCLVVVLIAIPLGARAGRRNLFVGVAGSIFICFAFFILQQLSLAMGLGGYLPGWTAAWLPNFIFGFVGIILMTRVR